MLSKIKLLLSLTDDSKDDLIIYLIQMATDEAINYTHRDDIDVLENAICSMVIYNYNQLGAENLTGESYSGLSFSYRNDYPDSIIRQLKAHRKVVFK